MKRQYQECHHAIIISHNTCGYSVKEKSQGRRLAGAESQGRHVTLIFGENIDNSITLSSMSKGESSGSHKIFQIG